VDVAALRAHIEPLALKRQVDICDPVTTETQL
jgi:hypothetical protein